MKITLPTVFDNVSFRKDGSTKLSFSSRELNAEEIMYLLGSRNVEGWLLFSIEANLGQEDVPNVKPNLDLKSPSERLRDVIFVLYKQETESQQFVGSFETFYGQKMEKLIDFVKGKLHD